MVPFHGPQETVGLHTIKDATGLGHLIVAGGGGGIPVIKDEKGRSLGN